MGSRIEGYLEVKMRWKNGPQFGERQKIVITRPDEDQQVKVTDWSWYNLLGRRVEGPQQVIPPTLLLSIDLESGVTDMGIVINEKEEKKP